jgi:undecaprenyl-diphosphatase
MGHLADRILALHGWAVVAVVFLLPALEASVFVGVIVPGEIAVLLGGVLAFQHRVSLPTVLAAAIAGAIVGDTIGYLVGRRWGRTILHSSIGRLVRHEHLDRAERFLAERGGPAVFLGRFTAALRALVPGLAGMARLRYRTFAAYNAAGGAAWATGFVLLGYVAGTGWRRVEHTAGRASLLLLVVLIAVGAVALAAAGSPTTPTVSAPWPTSRSSGRLCGGCVVATSASSPSSPAGYSPTAPWV